MTSRRKCQVCKGEGRVWLPLPAELLAFYDDEVKRWAAEGAEIKSLFRCDACDGSGFSA